MGTKLTKEKWNAIDAYVLEGDILKVTALLAPGGKIVSIIDKRHGLEWLVQPHKEVVTDIPEYDYHKYSGFGWDEHFPCLLPSKQPAEGKYKNAELPGAGEVWVKPWEIDKISDNTIGFFCKGEILPYVFSRSISISGDDTLVLSYTVKNTGEDQFAYIWAVHPFLWCDVGTRIILPPHIKEVLSSVDRENWEADKIYAWPQAVNRKGQVDMVDSVGPPTNKSHYKFYALPEDAITWTALLRKEPEGYGIKMDWESELEMYMGFVRDEGMYHPECRVAFELTNGYYDDLALAYNNKKVSIIQKGEEHTWKMKLKFSNNIQSII